MPATEETYRQQPALHLVFAISSIAMMLSTVWMVMADHLRPWKEVQREFQLVEREKLEATEKDKLEEQKTKYQKQIDEIDAKINAVAAERMKSITEDEFTGKIYAVDNRRFYKGIPIEAPSDDEIDAIS